MNSSFFDQRVGRWITLLLYSALMITLSHQPGDADFVAPFAHVDKVVHLIEYAVFAVLLLRALWMKDKPYIRYLTIAVIVLFAASDELHQSFIPGRDASTMDLLADLLGAGVGAALYALARSRRVRNKNQPPAD